MEEIAQKETPQEKGEVSSSFFEGKESDPRQEDEDNNADMVNEDSVQELETEIGKVKGLVIAAAKMGMTEM